MQRTIVGTRPSVEQQIAEACAQLGLTLEDTRQGGESRYVVDGVKYKASVLADLVLEGGLEFAWNAAKTRVRQDSPLRPAPVDTAAPVLVFHEQPALKVVVDEDCPGERDEVWDPAVSYQCGMRHNSKYDGIVGWREHEYSDTYGADHITQEWMPFYEVRLPGDPHPSRFCEDCAGWLTALAPHLLAEDAEQIEARDLVAGDVLIVEGEMLNVSSVKLDDQRVEFELIERFDTFEYAADETVFIKRRG